MIGTGAGTIAERKYAQGGAPVYMYIFTHESDAIVPGTQHKVGAAHALEIPYKFYIVQPAGQQRSGAGTGIYLDYPPGKPEEGAQHERDVEYFHENRTPGGQGPAGVAFLYYG